MAVFGCLGFVVRWLYRRPVRYHLAAFGYLGFVVRQLYRGPVRDHLAAFGCLGFVVRQPVLSMMILIANVG